MDLVKKIRETEAAYQILEGQCSSVDTEVTQYIIDNPLVQVLKSGVVWKKSEGTFRRWTQRYCILTNGGLIYFKTNSTQPQKFMLLNNYIVKALSEKEEKSAGRKYCFKVVFNHFLTKRDLIISCEDSKDLKQWVRAFHQNQLGIMTTKMELFAKRLSQQ